MVAVGPTTVNRGGPFDRPFESLRDRLRANGLGFDGTFDFPLGAAPRPFPRARPVPCGQPRGALRQAQGERVMAGAP